MAEKNILIFLILILKKLILQNNGKSSETHYRLITINA